MKSETINRTIYMDFQPGVGPPLKGDFVISIGKRGKVNSIYLILGVRESKPRSPAVARWFQKRFIVQRQKQRQRQGADFGWHLG